MARDVPVVSASINPETEESTVQERPLRYHAQRRPATSHVRRVRPAGRWIVLPSWVSRRDQPVGVTRQICKGLRIRVILGRPSAFVGRRRQNPTMHEVAEGRALGVETTPWAVQPMHSYHPCSQLVAVHESERGTLSPFGPAANQVRTRCYIPRAQTGNDETFLPSPARAAVPNRARIRLRQAGAGKSSTLWRGLKRSWPSRFRTRPEIFRSLEHVAVTLQIYLDRLLLERR